MDITTTIRYKMVYFHWSTTRRCGHFEFRLARDKVNVNAINGISLYKNDKRLMTSYLDGYVVIYVKEFDRQLMRKTSRAIKDMLKEYYYQVGDTGYGVDNWIYKRKVINKGLVRQDEISSNFNEFITEYAISQS